MNTNQAIAKAERAAALVSEALSAVEAAAAGGDWPAAADALDGAAMAAFEVEVFVDVGNQLLNAMYLARVAAPAAAAFGAELSQAAEIVTGWAGEAGSILTNWAAAAGRYQNTLRALNGCATVRETLRDATNEGWLDDRAEAAARNAAAAAEAAFYAARAAAAWAREEVAELGKIPNDLAELEQRFGIPEEAE